MTIKQYQYCIFSWSIKIWAPIFVHPKVVIDLKNDLYSPLPVSWSLWCRSGHSSYLPWQLQGYRLNLQWERCKFRNTEVVKKALCPRNLWSQNSDFYVVDFYAIRLLLTALVFLLACLMSLSYIRFEYPAYCFRRSWKIVKKSLLHLDIGSHGDHSTKFSGGHKHCYDSQWLLTGCKCCLNTVL